MGLLGRYLREAMDEPPEDLTAATTFMDAGLDSLDLLKAGPACSPCGCACCSGPVATHESRSPSPFRATHSLVSLCNCAASGLLQNVEDSVRAF